MSPLGRFARGKRNVVFEEALEPDWMIWKRENPLIIAVTR
jgi:hypothetical protein